MMLNLDQCKISIMSFSHNQDNQIRQDEFDPQDFIDRPMIILSSNSEPELPQLESIQPSTSITDPHELMLIERKRETEQDRLRRINSVKNIWNEIEEQAKKDEEDIRKNPPKKANLQLIKAKEAQLHNEFIGHRYLPIHVLQAAKEKLQDFKAHSKCQFHSVTKYTEQQILLKQRHRETLTRDVILACEELRIREDKTSYEKKLYQNNFDLLAYSYKIAEKIQENFYRKLYNKRSNKMGQAYTQQLKLIASQFRDKNNIAFRRKIIANVFDVLELAYASEDSLTCQKTKREEEEKRKQLIRENQKIAPESPIDLEDDIIQIPAMESLRSYESIRSRSDVCQQRPQDLKRRKEKQQQIRKNKKICKQTHQTLSKILRTMKQRTDRLRILIPTSLTFTFI